MCEGNHDLMEGRQAFEETVRWSGVSMPINSSTHLKVRGYDVQLLSLRWGGGGDDHAAGEEAIEASMKALMPQLNPWAFPILLAHHPHAFDYLGDAKIPLILAGHTHGGQINLAPWLKPARLRFRYLSGLYERDGRQLFVSNGVGNWFPLRINAPAEIVQITLRSA
jgi:predicted MPP superfamily phosphohydrolase